jgi:uncharacterized protein (TIGR02271 family)
MKKNQRKTAIGVFADRQEAQKAVNELRRAGFREDQIGVAGRDGETITGAHETGDRGTNAGIGAAAGAATGAGLGALWGIGIVAGLLPAIGPAIAGGTLAAILSSAAAGAAAAGIAGALIGLGIPEEEATYYESEFHAGRIIVTVNADGRYDEAHAILQRFQAYDYSTRDMAVKQAGNVQCATPVHTQGSAAGKVVQAKEERLHPHKESVKTGEVSVRKEVHTEQKTMQVPVTKEEVVIERHPVSGQQCASGDIKAGEEIRIPVREDQVHLEKEAVVKEEVVVGKRKVQGTEEVSGTVRKEEIKVDKKGDVDVKDKRR